MNASFGQASRPFSAQTLCNGCGERWQNGLISAVRLLEAITDDARRIGKFFLGAIFELNILHSAFNCQ